MTPPVTYVKPPAFLAKVINPVVVRLGVGTTLIVRGRVSGTPIRVPLGAPLELDGARYLVSGRGTTHWVRNLRAAGTATLRQHRRNEPFRAVEITGEEQVRIVHAYRERLGHSVDPYFGQLPDPHEHPVFRIDPIATSPAATTPMPGATNA